MKPVRPLHLSLGVVLVLVILTVTLAFMPAVQGWALRRAVAQPGLTLDFERVSAGPGAAALRGLTLEQDGLRLRIASAEANYSAWQFLTSGRLRLDRLVVTGLEIDATQWRSSPDAAGAAATPAAAPGALSRSPLPWELVIGEVNVSGRALLPGAAGRAALPAEFTLTGGGLTPGREGTFTLRARIADPSPGAPVVALQTVTSLLLRQDESRALDRVKLTLVADAEGPGFADQHQLLVTAELRPDAAAEHYALSVQTVSGARTEDLLQASALRRAGSTEFAGDWTLRAGRSQFAPFLLGAPLPEFAAQGGGAFAFDPATARLVMSGRLDGSASALETLAPGLGSLGALRFSTHFDLTEENAVAEFRVLELQVGNGQPVLQFSLQRPLAVNLAGFAAEVRGEAAGDVAALTLQQVPLAWIAPFLDGIELRSGTASGRFVVRAEGPALRIGSVAPLTVMDLTAVADGVAWLDRAALSLRLSAGVSPDGWEARVDDLELRTAAGDRVDAGAAVRNAAAPGGALALEGNWDADLPRLLAPAGLTRHVRSRGRIGLERAEAGLRVTTFRTEWDDGSGRRLAAVEAVEPFSLDEKTLQLRAVVPDGSPVLRVMLAAMPLSALPVDLPWAGEFGGAELVLAPRQGRLVLASTAPWRLTGLDLGPEASRLLSRVGLEIAPQFDYAGTADWKFSLGPAQLTDAGGRTLATLGLEAGATVADGIRTAANFNVDLARLGTQPGFTSLKSLTAGRFSGEIRAALSEADGSLALSQAEGRSTLNGLVTAEAGQALPVANVNFRLLCAADGGFTLEVPLLLDRLGQRSEIRLQAEAVRRGDDMLFDARIAGDHLELGDLLALAAVGSNQPVPAAAGSAVPPSVRSVPSADETPFWAGWRGEVALDLRSISRGKDWSMTNLRGVLVMDPHRIALQKVEALIDGTARLAARGDLRFTPGEQPYSLGGNFSLTQFDVGALLRALDPERPPTLEGLFTVAGGFSGRGMTLDDTLARTGGQMQLTSGQGVFRGLRRTSEKVSVATRAVELGAALGSLFGSNRVREAAERVAGQTYQVDQLAQQLAELPFDQFVLRLQRDDRLDVRVEEISLLSPELRFTGKGALTHVQGRSLLEMPVNISYRLAVREKMEQAFSRLRALDGTKDDLGYSRVRDTGTIGGTLARPDPTQLFLKLAGEALAPTR